MLDHREVITKAIEHLSSCVTVSAGLTHPLDESAAKELFKALHKKGIPLIAHEIHSEATNQSWPARHAKKLAELGERIGVGGRVQIKTARNWGEPTVEKIFAELGIK